MGLTDFLAGWALGAKTGNRGFDEVLGTGRQIFESKEFQDFVAAGRSHVAFALEELAEIVAGDGTPGQGSSEDLVDFVRSLVARRDQWMSGFPRPPAPGD